MSLAAAEPALRKKMGNAAVKLAESVGYVNAGTMEFLVDNEGHYYFIEMNTRIQVEHTITEEVYGCDLVKEQIKIAAGDRLSAARRECDSAIARDPVPHQCRGSGEELPALAGKIAFYYAPGRSRSADRFARLHRLRRAAVLRLDDCQAHLRSCDARLVYRSHAARARRVLHHRDQDDGAVPQHHHAQRRLPRG
jgi:hypothetical protein